MCSLKPSGSVGNVTTTNPTYIMAHQYCIKSNLEKPSPILSKGVFSVFLQKVDSKPSLQEHFVYQRIGKKLFYPLLSYSPLQWLFNYGFPLFFPYFMQLYCRDKSVIFGWFCNIFLICNVNRYDRCQVTSAVNAAGVSVRGF